MKNLVNKISQKWNTLRERIKFLWFVLTTKDESVQDDWKLAVGAFKKRIEIKKRLENLDPKDKDMYETIRNSIPKRLQEGMFVAAKSIRKQVEEEKHKRELYDKTQLVDDVMKLLNKYVDTQVDLAAKVSKAAHDANSWEKVSIENDIRDALKVNYVEEIC